MVVLTNFGQQVLANGSLFQFAFDLQAMKRNPEFTEYGSGSEERPAKHRKRSARNPTPIQPVVESAEDVKMAISTMDSRLLADYVAQRNRRFGEHLSSVEIENMRIPGKIRGLLEKRSSCSAENAILDTSGWDQERLLQFFPSFLEHFAQSSGASASLAVAPEKPGTPHTLVLTAAALRAVELVRYDSTLFYCASVRTEMMPGCSNCSSEKTPRWRSSLLSISNSAKPLTSSGKPGLLVPAVSS